MPNPTKFESAQAAYKTVAQKSPVPTTTLLGRLLIIENTGAVALANKDITKTQYATTLRDHYEAAKDLPVRPPYNQDQIDLLGAKVALFAEMITPENPTAEQPAGPTDTTQIPTNQRKA